MHWNQQSKKLANLVHQKPIKILDDVGFCIPEDKLLTRLTKAGFLVDIDTRMVKVSSDLLETA
ncbi:MAG: hypothetical protein ISR59_04055 [Anaerolineales bacterium]|uniref:Uncharacterized protein n=1 Tax=Candidatus Desulfolinea nitratireducens TaxID=2841698 RepID=A0A8J6NK76_9CHLR|nr:hypothetical protein [Candidatus Desulfolinea nitratireducens]MBL6960259.1 hypothetical protein [Anaerolineales bacterium]